MSFPRMTTGSKNHSSRPRRLATLGTLALLGTTVSTIAHSADLPFSLNAAGSVKAMTHWGVDTAWPSYDNVRQTYYHMGVDQTDVARINFFMDEPLQADGSIGPESRARIDNQLNLARMGNPNIPLALTPATGDGTHSYYLDANGVADPARWLALMEATQRYVNRPIHSLEVFNEPDYWGGMGPPETLLAIMQLTERSPYFQGTELHAASTLCSCAARAWYDVVAGPTTHGALHQLAGSADDYINFIQHVQAQGDIAYNDELHSMAEVLMGAEYGMVGGIWWADVLRARGLLVNAVQGRRLAYAENRGYSSAAAVYRSNDGEVYGFAGSFERHGPTHSYRFISTDQDVYFNGIGPLREFMLPTWAGPQGGLVHIDTAPTLPALDGHRWKIINRATGQVLEVAGAATTNGGNIQVYADNGGAHQRWHIQRTREDYYLLTNARSGITAEVGNWSTTAGGNIQQWGTGTNLLQQWWLKPAADGYFYIHNGHSNLVMTATSGGNVIHADAASTSAQQWQFVQDDAADRGALVARYPAAAGDIAQHTNAVQFDGASASVSLASDVANSTDITVAAWVYWRGGNNWQRIFDFGVNAERYFFLSPADGGNQMKFAITTAGYGEEETLLTSALPQNQWVHVAVTLGGNSATLYVNGRAQVAGHVFTNPTDIFSAGGTPQNFLGKSQFAADPLFNGALDDVRIYDYALNAADIQGLANPTPADTAPADTASDAVGNFTGNYAHYPLDGDLQTDTNQNTAIATGTPNYTQSLRGQALMFDGVDDYVTLPTNIAATEDITLSTWVYWNGGSPWQRIFDFGIDTNRYLFLSPANADGQLDFSITTDGYLQEQNLTAAALPTGQWVHVVVVLSGMAGGIYVDGQLKALGLITLNPSDVLAGATQHNYLGKSQFDWDPLFNGQIDDISVYHRALSWNEVRTLHQGGRPQP